MKQKTFLLSLAIFGLLAGCGKKEAGKVASPEWTTDNSGKYPATMTAVVQIPANLLKNKSSSDKLAAFIQNECRGVGEFVQADTLALYFVLIKGKASENDKVQFRYYSGNTSQIYETSYFLDFVMDGNFGTAGEPEILNLAR